LLYIVPVPRNRALLL